MDYQESVLTGQRPTAAVLVQNRRLLADWIKDRKVYEHRQQAKRQLDAMAGERDAGERDVGAHRQLLSNMLIETSAKTLVEKRMKIHKEISEILSRIQTRQKDAQAKEIEAHCLAISSAAQVGPGTRQRYGRALDELEKSQAREALRDDSQETRESSRLIELRRRSAELAEEMMVPENLRLSDETPKPTDWS